MRHFNEKYIWSADIFDNIIKSNIENHSFILYGSIYKNWWTIFANTCKKYKKTAVVLTPKSISPSLYQQRKYPPNLRHILSEEHVLHWEVCSLGLEVVLNKKANLYKKQYGGFITNNMLLCGNRAENGLEIDNIGTESRHISSKFW